MQCCVIGCKQLAARADMRQHVAAHLLLGEVDLGLGDQACGFCGAVVSNARCTPGWGSGSRGATIKVTAEGCPCEHSKMSYKAALNSTPKAPSTNVPMKCRHCQKVVWKYHMLSHCDVCSKLPANYQLDGDDEQQLCISSKEYEAVLKKHKASAEKQQQRLREIQAEYEGFAAEFWKLLL